MDCTDVGVEPLASLLDGPELSIVAAPLNSLIERLVLSLTTDVELLLTNECDQCIATLEDDREAGVSVTQELLRRVRRMSRQVLQHAQRLLAHPAIRLHHERQQSVVVRLSDGSVLAHLLLRANDGGDEWSVSDSGVGGERRGVGGTSARHIDVQLDAVTKEQQVAMAVPMLRFRLVGA